ncbi:hypothetical protein D3C81_1666990 [compost metagenome]
MLTASILTVRKPRRCARAASSIDSVPSRTRANIRISARDATSNRVGLLSCSGQVLRSIVATSPGAATAPKLNSHAVNKRTMRKRDVSITKPARHYS